MKTNYEKLLPFWLKRLKLHAESDKLHAESHKRYAKGDKLQAEGYKLYDEGYKLYAESYKLYDEGDKLWKKAVSKVYGNSKMKWKDNNCILSDGTEFSCSGVEEVLLHLNWDKI